MWLHIHPFFPISIEQNQRTFNMRHLTMNITCMKQLETCQELNPWPHWPPTQWGGWWREKETKDHSKDKPWKGKKTTLNISWVTFIKSCLQEQEERSPSWECLTKCSTRTSPSIVGITLAIVCKSVYQLIQEKILFSRSCVKILIVRTHAYIYTLLKPVVEKYTTMAE